MRKYIESNSGFQSQKNKPEYIPAIGVLTPLAFDTAERVNAPQVGMELKNDPKILHNPIANIS